MTHAETPAGHDHRSRDVMASPDEDGPASTAAVPDSTCLRPLGQCELGGCCDVCWYRPDHPRFQERHGA